MTVMATGLDLEAFEADATRQVPPGWEPIAELCARTERRIDELGLWIVERIRTEIPAYAEAGVPTEDLLLSVRRNLEMILRGLSERRAPTEDELLVRRNLGRRRAEQSLPIDALIQAYHVGYRELWQALVASAGDDPAETSDLLLSAVTTTWMWIHANTSAIADAHREVMQSAAEARAALRQRFGDLLATADVGSPNLAGAARALGFDSHGEFQAYAVPVDSHAAIDPEAIEAVNGASAAYYRGDHFVVVTQGVAEREVVDAIRVHDTSAAIGIGLVRRELAGARASVADATACAGVAPTAGLSRFEDDWVLVAVEQAPDRFRPLFEHASVEATRHPHLAEAVRAYANCAFSLTKTAERLCVHLNTVVYRLRRWHEVTGLDPRTYRGLSRSLVALDLAAT